MKIPMTSNVFKIVEIKKKSSAKMFEDLKVGDEIFFTIEIEHLGTSRGRTYAPYIRVENLKTGNYTFKSFNQMDSVLSSFELQ